MQDFVYTLTPVSSLEKYILNNKDLSSLIALSEVKTSWVQSYRDQLAIKVVQKCVADSIDDKLSKADLDTIIDYVDNTTGISFTTDGEIGYNKDLLIHQLNIQPIIDQPALNKSITMIPNKIDGMQLGVTPVLVDELLGFTEKDIKVITTIHQWCILIRRYANAVITCLNMCCKVDKDANTYNQYQYLKSQLHIFEKAVNNFLNNRQTDEVQIDDVKEYDPSVIDYLNRQFELLKCMQEDMVHTDTEDSDDIDKLINRYKRFIHD